MQILKFTLFLYLLITLNACVGGKLYRSALPGNLTIKTELDSVKAQLEFFRIDEQCQRKSLGGFKLKAGETRVGIAPSGATYYEVTFKGFSLLWGSSSLSTSGIINTRKGYDYELAVSYVDNIYNAVAYEVDQRGRKRELEGLTPRRCRGLSLTTHPAPRKDS